MGISRHLRFSGCFLDREFWVPTDYGLTESCRESSVAGLICLIQ